MSQKVKCVILRYDEDGFEVIIEPEDCSYKGHKMHEIVTYYCSFDWYTIHEKSIVFCFESEVDEYIDKLINYEIERSAKRKRDFDKLLGSRAKKKGGK